jgi:nucleotide-binding universal stress UspA family protein
MLKEKGHKFECGLLHGHPAASLIEFADHYSPNLIVMGAKGLRATFGILLGGVAQQVVEHAHWPVLIVRPNSISIHRILIATDGSEFSQTALNFVVDFPSIPDVEYHIVNVVPPMPGYEPGNIPRSWQLGSDIFQTAPIDYTNNLDELHKKNEANGSFILEHAVNFLEKYSIHSQPNLLHGDAATEILEYVKINQIDMIVIGSRGLSEVSGWLLGSVSRKIVHYATCSVLIVKQKHQI